MKTTDIAYNDNNRNDQYGKVWVSHVVLFTCIRLQELAELLRENNVTK